MLGDFQSFQPPMSKENAPNTKLKGSRRPVFRAVLSFRARGVSSPSSPSSAPDGAPFLAPAELPQFPEPREDLMAAEYTVNRGVSNVPKILEHGRAHDCNWT